jgi:hypothetical protein
MDFAALTGNAPVVRALLSLGVGATTKSLVHAVDHPDTVRLLLAARPPVGGLVRVTLDGLTATPLMRAALRAMLDSVQLLLAAGASWSRRNDVGCTALMYSVCSRSDDAAAVLGVVQALLAAGSLVELRDLAGNTALHVLALVSHGKPWAADAARLLLGSGADRRTTNYIGKTPLQCLPVTARGGALHRLL